MKKNTYFVNNFSEINFQNLKLLDHIFIATDKHIENYNFNQYDYFILVGKYNDVFYKFAHIKNHIELYDKNHNLLLFENETKNTLNSNNLINEIPEQLIDKITVTPIREHSYIFKFPNSNEFVDFNYLHDIRFSYKKISDIKLSHKNNHLKTIYSNLPLIKSAIFKIENYYDYSQTLVIKINKNQYLLFSIVYNFKCYDNNRLFSGFSPYQKNKENVIVNLNSSRLITLINNDKYCDLTDYINFDDAYQKAKKLYHNKTFDEFDELLKLQSYNAIDYVLDDNKFDNLANEFMSQTNIDKHLLELNIKPVYVNNDIRYYHCQKNKVVALNKNNELITDLNKQDFNIANAIIDFNLNIVESVTEFNINYRQNKYGPDLDYFKFNYYDISSNGNNSKIFINPYNCEIYKSQDKLKKNIDYRISYEDNDAIIVIITKENNQSIYIEKVNNHYILIDRTITKNMKKINEINKRATVLKNLTAND